jgi:hypothetical protein
MRRIAHAFRHVVLDRARGEAAYQKEWDKVKSLNAPEVILQTYSLANCRTVWVQVSDDDGNDGWVRFILWPRREINIDFGDDTECARLLPTVKKLATLLGYVVGDGENVSAMLERAACGRAVGDVVFRFAFAFPRHENPPGFKVRFENALREYLHSSGVDFGMAGVEDKVYTRGYVRGKERPVTHEDQKALMEWVMAQRIRCNALLGELEEEIDALDLFDNKGGSGFVVDNLTEEDRLAAAECRAVADHYLRGGRE